MKRKHFLTPAEKAELARLYKTGRLTIDELAEKYDIAKSTASKLCRGTVAHQANQADELIALGVMVADVRQRAAQLGYTLTLTKG